MIIGKQKTYKEITTLDFDEFDDYIARMDVKTEEMLNQITLEDLM